jgi:Domain of unknown function (DUF4279)
MSDYEFTISLCIRHPTIDPSAITESLGIKPQHTWRAGDARRGAAGEELDGVYRQSYWTGRLMDDPQLSSERTTVESVLLQTLAQLRRSHDFLQQISTDGGTAELIVSLFARGIFRLDLSPESSALLGRLRLTIAFDIHPHSPRKTSLPAAN